MKKFTLCSLAVAGMATAYAGVALGEVDAGDLAAFDAMRPDPGKYRTDAELISFEAPGIDANIRGMISQAMAGGFQRENTYCLKSEDTGKDWLQSLAKSDCTLDSFSASGNSFSSRMTCKVDGGQKATIDMSGTASGNSSDVTMAMDMVAPELGRMTMKMRMKSQRVGDCG